MTMMITYHDIERVGGGGDHSDGTGRGNHKGVMARHRNRVPSKIIISIIRIQCDDGGAVMLQKWQEMSYGISFVKTN